ncbi:MAG: efflux RND transporter periplasmic adaptor subunit [Spirochaetales bacterium]|nr:efflux RND transporter periplasmic adaptor subunit [Spirochaetales bacterium]
MKKLLLISLTALFIFSCANEAEDAVSAASSWEVKEKESLPVYTQDVIKEPFIKALNTSGIVEGIKEADVISQTSGLITGLYFEIGDFVETGDVLLQVDDRVPRISYESAVKDFEAAKIEFEALEKSYSTGGTSQLLYSQGRARMESSRLRMEQAREQLDNTTIRAPFSGYISSRDKAVSPGNYIQPARQVTHIVDQSAYVIRIALGEDEISLVKKGDPVTVTLNSLPDLEIQARVTAVSPGSRTGGTFPLLVSWDDGNPGVVRSGMTAQVQINPEIKTKEELIVPSSALLRRDGLDYVFRVRENAAEAVQITKLESLGDRTSVRIPPGSDTELEPGDRLIVSGLASLAPGDPVIPEALGDDS